MSGDSLKLDESVLGKPCDEVHVYAPARLHLGFLDPTGHLGRRFGSIGVAIEEIGTELKVSKALSFKITGQGSERVGEIAKSLLDKLQVPDRVHIHLATQIPAHCGLGSGTQLALSLGVALARLWGKTLDVRQIAWLTGRGKRSGVGIAAFEGGGFVVDGGRGEGTKTPPCLARLYVPESWRWLLIFDERCQGLSGQRETQAFLKLPSFSRATSAELCYQLLSVGLPALAEERFVDFCACLAKIQQANGEYFASAQNGVYLSPKVAEVLAWLKCQGWSGLGQSSWGPTGFCLLPDPQTAKQVEGELKTRFEDSLGLRFKVVRSRNRGATVW
jgi:beta-ribofuranosylaminobenzene 5'-phosphate synthase